MALTQVSSGGIADGAVTTNDLENSGVTAGTYGSSSAIPAITVDAKGRITSASTSSIDSTAITNGTSNVSVAASGDITVTRAGTIAGEFLSTGIHVNDNIKFTAGTGQDLQIYHDGTNSKIENTSGDLYINSKSGEAGARFVADGAAELFYDNSSKLATTSGGIDVTGQVVCDGLVVDGGVTFSNGTGQLDLKDNNDSGNAAIQYVRGIDSTNTQQWFVGNATSSADIFLGNSQTGSIYFQTASTNRCLVTSSGHFIPNGGNTYDLGDSTNRWRNVYTNDLNLSNEGSTNDVDGTWGSWTIQEGEDDLFLLNRRNGKKYKFNLSEVN